MTYLFNRKLQYDEIAVLEELLRYLVGTDDYDFNRSYKCKSIGGIVSKFLKKRGVSPSDYSITMIGYLQTLVHTDTLGYLLSEYAWKDFLDTYSREEAINRFKYFIEHGVPYKLFFFQRNDAKTWLKVNAKINENYN